MNTEPREDLFKRRVLLVVGAVVLVALLSLSAVIRSHILVTLNTFFRTPPALFSLYSADFMCFYAAAQVGAKSLAEVYEPAVLDAAQASITGAVGARNPHYNYVYPPFITQLIVLFSRLSFGWAYYSWMALSYGMTAVAVFLLTPLRFTRGQRIFCGLGLPLGFPFFSFHALMAGQLSSIGLLIFALVIRLRHSFPFWAGASLALGLYKPPLFVGYAVLTLAAREWKVIQGALIGSLALVGLSIAITGTAPWEAFLIEASGYIYGGRLSDGRSLPAGKGMGLLSSSIGLTGNTTTGWAIFVILFLSAVAVHTRTRQKAVEDSERQNSFEQASRIALTYLFSIQALNYDASLLLVPIMLVVSAYVMRPPTLSDLYLFACSLLWLVVAGTMDTENGDGISTGGLSIIGFWLVLLRVWRRTNKTGLKTT